MKKWLAIVAAVLVLAACSEKEETKEHEEKETVEVEKETPEVEESSNRFPLSGIQTDNEITGRSIAAVINNHPLARPQSGLHQADIVYELLAEGDVTRFLAIFQSEHPDKIGPVRSARDYHIEIAKGFDSFFVAHGYSPDAKNMLENGYIDHINGMEYDGTLFKRASFRKAPHNSYTTYENILKGAEKTKATMDEAPDSFEFFTETEAEKSSGREAAAVSVAYGSPAFEVTYEFNEAEKKYERYSGGELTADLETEAPVLLDNILILEVDHRVIDNSGRRELNLASGGKGLLVQKGIVTDIDWENVDGRLVPMLNGSEAKLVPGKTWVNIMPANPGIEQSVSIGEDS
ncbi:DUF3048 domain-containing protein [Mesobacillus harenae]|uniref:DUF3048 domain-containing protein n=1 Tax=Mesobacillus harenae TaxID=2213203 RepID=UPI00158047AD|nr:DUF3048 domain-containing protein [Mesobacillus harenae]